MSDYIVHRGDFIEINSSTIVKVSSFCYINELLEKVITEKVLNVTDFLNGEEPVIEEFDFIFPNIPYALEAWVSTFNNNKKDFQCK